MTFHHIKLIAWLSVLITVSAVSERGLPIRNEICNSYSGRRTYLELDEHGKLQATNIVIPTTPNVWKLKLNYYFLYGWGSFSNNYYVFNRVRDNLKLEKSSM